jgi:hypothetical protein
LREDINKGVYVENLTEVEVQSVQDVVQLLLVVIHYHILHCKNTIEGSPCPWESARKSDEADKEMFDFCDNDYREQPIGEWRPQT